MHCLIESLQLFEGMVVIVPMLEIKSQRAEVIFVKITQLMALEP